MDYQNALVHPDRVTNGRRFIINLTAHRDEPVKVRSCEIKGRAFTNRTSFGEGATLRQAFCAPMVRALEKVLAPLTFKTEVMSMPDFLCELEGLTLRGIHLMATRLSDGAINVIIRFLSFIGGINYALAPDLGFDDPVFEEGQGIAACVLEDIAAPLLNICATAAVGLKETNELLGAFGKKIAMQTDEIQFRTQLLRRYVERCAEAMTPPPPDLLMHFEEALAHEERRRPPSGPFDTP